MAACPESENNVLNLPMKYSISPKVLSCFMVLLLRRLGTSRHKHVHLNCKIRCNILAQFLLQPPFSMTQSQRAQLGPCSTPVPNQGFKS